MTTPQLHLTTSWTPAAEGRPLAYTLALTNRGAAPLENFRLGINGPARIDVHARIEGGTLLERLSNHTLLAPPPGVVLAPGATWTVVVHGLSFPLRHWSDGANAAYAVLADGSVVRVGTEPTTLAGGNAPLLKGAVRLPMPATAPAPISVIPWPRQVAVSGAVPTPPGLALAPQGEDAEAAASTFAALTADLFPAEGLVRPAAESGWPVRIEARSGMAPEGYAIAFAVDGATVAATTRTGMLYGLVTLGQILRGARQFPGRLSFPAAGGIEDEPGLGWRGTHLDVARQFYASAEIERLLKLLAWGKMNRFHWHLSDDEAWRVEIDAFPELTAVGAWRGYGRPLPPLLGGGPQPTGGYYSKDAIRRIVALGQRLGIAIVPEIDMPGHCYAVLQALPGLRDPDEIGEYQSVQGFPNNCLNPAVEQTYDFAATVIDEMLDLFPAGLFHLGADEVPLAAWSGSPLALARLEDLGGVALADRHRAQLNQIGHHDSADAIEGSATAVLQAEFIRRVHAHLRQRGAVTGGWEEAAHGDVLDKAASYLVGWRNVEINAALAAAGYDIVVAPGQRYYLDMANALSWTEPGAGWAGWSGPEETYAFEPRHGLGAAQLAHLLGVQTCIWSESMTDRAIFDRLVFPRLWAVAETGWTLPAGKSWPRFSAFSGFMPILYDHWAEGQS